MLDHASARLGRKVDQFAMSGGHWTRCEGRTTRDLFVRHENRVATDGLVEMKAGLKVDDVLRVSVKRYAYGVGPWCRWRIVRN